MKRKGIKRPYSHTLSEDEEILRTQAIQQLHEKVLRQREIIRRNDQKFELVKQMKKQDKQNQVRQLRTARRSFEQRLRLMANSTPSPRTRTYTKIISPEPTPMALLAHFDSIFALTSPKHNFSLRQSLKPKSPKTRHLSEKPQYTPEPEGPELTSKSRLQMHQSRLVSSVGLKSPAYRKMMENELKKIQIEAEMSYESFVETTKSKQKTKFPLYKKPYRLDVD